jgi:hypothetical protein
MNSTLKGFLNFLGGLTGGNNNVPDIPLPLGTEAPKKAVKKAVPAKKKPAPKKATPKKKEA